MSYMTVSYLLAAKAKKRRWLPKAFAAKCLCCNSMNASIVITAERENLYGRCPHRTDLFEKINEIKKRLNFIQLAEDKIY